MAASPAKFSIDTTMPFKVLIYSELIEYALRYEITQQDCKVIYMPETEGGKDSLIFQTPIKKQTDLKGLRDINVEKLKDRYDSRCAADGLQLRVVFVTGIKEKEVWISNSYQPNIALVIEFINSMIPEEYRIWYDKKELIRRSDCSKIKDPTIIDPR